MRAILASLWLMLLQFGSNDAEPFLLMTGTNSGSSKGYIYRMDVTIYRPSIIPHNEAIYNPLAVDYDAAEDEIYWSEGVSTGRIRKSSLSGGRATTVMSSYGAHIEGLVVDSGRRLLFYTDTYHKVICMVRLNSPYTKDTIIGSGLDRPRAIVADKGREQLYWTDWGVFGQIKRASYDGSGQVILVSSSLYFVNAIALDLPNYDMYWVDAYTDQVEKSNMDGVGRQILLRAASKYHFFGMALYDCCLFITDWGDEGTYTNISKMIKLTKDGDGLVVSTLDNVRWNDVHAYDPTASGNSLVAQTSYTAASFIAAVVVVIAAMG